MSNDNRGAVGMSNSDTINGVTKPNGRQSQSRYGGIDTTTLINIEKAYNNLTKHIKESNKTTKGFEELIEKQANAQAKRIKDEKDREEQQKKQIKELTEKYGENSKELKALNQRFKRENKKAKDSRLEEEKKERIDILKQSFKNYTKDNQMQVFDNKYAKSKGNDFANINNEYYNQLEKLKISGLETFGARFEDSEEFKKALVNLNKDFHQQYIDIQEDYKKQMKEEWKENHKILSSVQEGIKDTFERNKESLQGLLGPFNLIISPLQEFFGGFGKLFGGIKSIFGKFKKKPTANDVLKAGPFGVGSLYIANTIKECLGIEGGEKKGLFDSLKEKIVDKIKGGKNLLDKGKGLVQKGGKAGKGLLKGLKGAGGKLIAGNAKVMASGAWKAFSKVAGPTAIIAGSLMMAKDGIQGYMKSAEWGTSKLSSSIGGALGGTKSGWEGAKGNMGKYAAIGAGVGTAFGPLGTLVGAGVGAVVGGITGAIGGERMAKGMDKMGNWFKEGWGKITENCKEAWGKFKDGVSAGWNKLKEGTKEAWTKTTEVMGKAKDKVTEVAKTAWDRVKDNAQKKIDLGKKIFEQSNKIFNESKKILTDSSKGASFKNNVLNFTKYIFGGLKKNINKVFKSGNTTKILKANLVSPIEKVFGSVKNFFTNIFGGASKSAQENVTDVNDAIIRTDGSVIKTNPQDTLIALKDIDTSMNAVKSETNKSLNNSLNEVTDNRTNNSSDIVDKMATIIDILSKILSKDVQTVNPPQTRYDLDLIMSGGMI